MHLFPSKLLRRIDRIRRAAASQTRMDGKENPEIALRSFAET